MSVVTARSRDRLNAARDRTRKAREELRRAKDGRDVARKLDDHQAVMTTEVRVAQAEDEVEMASELERVLLGQVAGVDGAGYGGESFLDNPDTIRTLEQIAHSSQPIGNLMLGPYMDAEQFADYIGSGRTMAAAGDVVVPADSRIQRPYGIVPQLYRPTRLLDVIPHDTMTGLSFTYVREAGTLDSAAETVEGATKPEDTGLDLSGEGTVTAVTIAAWKKLRRQSLDDLPGLATMINQRLLYLVERRIEAQVIAGDGVGPNMLGVLGTSGIGSIAYVSATPASDLILQGLTAVRLSNAEPSAVLLNPTTYQGLLTKTASGSGERLDSGGAFESPADSIWGVPVIQSAIVPATMAIVGDWGRATTLFVREGANIRISDSDQDDFLKNRVTALAEARVGLAVWQPTAIVQVHLA